MYKLSHHNGTPVTLCSQFGTNLYVFYSAKQSNSDSGIIK